MGMSIDATLVYGVPIGNEEDTEFPWTHDDGFEDWWDRIIGADNIPGSPFGPDGNWANPDDPDRQTKASNWMASRREHRQAHPCPVELELHGYLEYPSYIIRVPGVDKLWAHDHGALNVSAGHMNNAAHGAREAGAVDTVRQFMEDHELEPTDAVGWYLVWSYSR